LSVLFTACPSWRQAKFLAVALCGTPSHTLPPVVRVGEHARHPTSSTDARRSGKSAPAYGAPTTGE